LRISERNGTTGIGNTTGPSRPANAGGRFVLGESAATARTASMQAAAPAGALDGLLAIQAAGDQIGLLTGSIGAGELTSLRQQLKQQREMADDPALDDLLAHVDLRAEVELAKLTRR
jgi:Class II flagellar assembly regulator